MDTILRTRSAHAFSIFLSNHSLFSLHVAATQDLKDLKLLLEHVRNSDCLVILQSAHIMERPWCLLEIHTAIEARVPIVSINCAGKGYNFAEASNLLLHLDTTLETRNPGATAVLRREGADVLQLAYVLSTCVPNIISVPFDPSASRNGIQASMLDILESMVSARPQTITGGSHFTEWLEARPKIEVGKAEHGAGQEAATEHGAGSAHEAHEHGKANHSRRMAYIPRALPALPNGFVVRDAIIKGIKSKLFPDGVRNAAAGGNSTSNSVASLAIVGMGGSGKTVIASAVARDTEVRSHFEIICYVAMGQAPVIHDLQASIYFQLTRRHVDASVAADDDALWEALREAAAGKCVMLIVDDAWDKSHVKAFSVLDDESGSCLVITTRLQGLVAGASEFELGFLEADDAAALMLEVAGEHDIKPPYPKLVLDAVELCGRLPLVLSIAGGMLEEHGGEVDEDFIKILSEEHMESIRVGEKGDELVTIEDRLVQASLNQYQGKDKVGIEALFRFFAVFPEDVPISMGLLDLLSEQLLKLAGQEVIRAQRKVRSWTTALIRCALLKGSLHSGVYFHDIIRHFSQHSHSANGLQEAHKIVVDTLVQWVMDPANSSLKSSRDLRTWYVERHLYHHIRGAVELSEGIPASDEFLESLAKTHDNAIMSALVGAVGVEEAVAHAMGVHAAAGRNIDAARWLVAVSGTRISKVMSHDVLQRAESLLSEVGKDQIRGDDDKLIKMLVTRIVHHVPVDEMQAIFKKWNKAELFDIKTASASVMMAQYFQDVFVKLDFLFEAEGGDTVPAEQLKVIVDFGYEWRGLSTNELLNRVLEQEGEDHYLYQLGITCGSVFTSGSMYGIFDIFPRLNLDRQKLQPYLKLDLKKHFQYCKSNFDRNCGLLNGGVEQILLARLCELDDGLQLTTKIADFLRQLCQDHGPTKCQDMLTTELGFRMGCHGLTSILYYIGESELARSLLIGLKFSALHEGDLSETTREFLGISALAQLFGEEAINLLFALQEGLVSDLEAFDTKMIPSVDGLQALDCIPMIFNWSFVSFLTLAALMFERFGDDGKAAECCERALELHRKPFARMEAHLVLARVAKRANNAADAARHFKMVAAWGLRLRAPLFVLVAGRDCGGALGEFFIERAISVLNGKTRDDFVRMGIAPRGGDTPAAATVPQEDLIADTFDEAKLSAKAETLLAADSAAVVAQECVAALQAAKPQIEAAVKLVLDREAAGYSPICSLHDTFLPAVNAACQDVLVKHGVGSMPTMLRALQAFADTDDAVDTALDELMQLTDLKELKSSAASRPVDLATSESSPAKSMLKSLSSKNVSTDPQTFVGEWKQLSLQVRKHRKQIHDNERGETRGQPVD